MKRSPLIEWLCEPGWFPPHPRWQDLIGLGIIAFFAYGLLLDRDVQRLLSAVREHVRATFELILDEVWTW